MKFRRKSEPTQGKPIQGKPDEQPDTAPTPDAVSPDDVSPDDVSAEPPTPGTSGPYDESEVAGDGVERIDLGSLLLAPSAGRELRLQVDESSGAVQSVLLAGADGALELQAFAAPRGGDLWAEVRPQIQEDVERRGGTVEEREGRFGTELVCQIPIQNPDNKPLVQPSRIVGVNGARWMLRGTFLGRPAIEPEGVQDWEDLLAGVVVRRGAEAKPVGEPLVATLPDNVKRVG